MDSQRPGQRLALLQRVDAGTEAISGANIPMPRLINILAPNRSHIVSQFIWFTRVSFCQMLDRRERAEIRTIAPGYCATEDFCVLLIMP